MASPPPSSSPPSSPPLASSPSPTPTPPRLRQLHQLGLYFMGASFFAASIFVTRRAVIRRRLSTMPAFYTSNRYPNPFSSFDRYSLAIQALGLATLNVTSFGYLLVGGIAWGFDLCSVAELRDRTRASLRRSGAAVQNPEEEREMEETFRSLLDNLGFDVPPPSNDETEDANK